MKTNQMIIALGALVVVLILVLGVFALTSKDNGKRSWEETLFELKQKYNEGQEVVSNSVDAQYNSSGEEFGPDYVANLLNVAYKEPYYVIKNYNCGTIENKQDRLDCTSLKEAFGYVNKNSKRIIEIYSKYEMNDVDEEVLKKEGLDLIYPYTEDISNLLQDNNSSIPSTELYSDTPTLNVE